jgi:alkylglycerol monooxygenase
LERKFGINKSKTPLNSSLKKHIRLQTIITLSALFLFVLFEHYFTTLQLLIGALFILLSVINTGAMLEQKNWIFYLEYTRLLLLAGFIQTYYPDKNVLLLLTIVLLVPVLYFKTLKAYYYKALY